MFQYFLVQAGLNEAGLARIVPYQLRNQMEPRQFHLLHLHPLCRKPEAQLELE